MVDMYLMVGKFQAEASYASSTPCYQVHSWGSIDNKSKSDILQFKSDDFKEPTYQPTYLP